MDDVSPDLQVHISQSNVLAGSLTGKGHTIRHVDLLNHLDVSSSIVPLVSVNA